MTILKKILTMILSLALIFTFLPIGQNIERAEAESLGAGFITFSSDSPFSISSQKINWDGKLYVSTDSDLWTEINKEGTDFSVSAKTPDLSGKYHLYFRGKENTKIAGDYSSKWSIDSTSKNGVDCTGDIMTLLNYELPSSATMDKSCFSWMFSGCKLLKSAPNLTAITASEKCYSYMFNGCTMLKETAVMSAYTMAKESCVRMYNGCTALTSVLPLSASSLAESCYEEMFRGCKALVQAPELNATVVFKNCYNSMFSGCISLAKTPVLPALDLKEGCYNSMFSGCKALTEVSAISAVSTEKESCMSMFSDCTSLKTAPELHVTALKDSCYKAMFSGCTALKFPSNMRNVVALEINCCKNMYSGCTSLKISELHNEFYANSWTMPSVIDSVDWNTGMITGSVGIFQDTPQTNTTYYFSDDYTVKFSMQGHGTAPETQYIINGNKAIKPVEPLLEGYSFDGWYKEPSYKNEWDFDKEIITADTTIYAKWTRYYEVTFNVQGHGTAPASQLVRSGETVVKPTDPKLTGYSFDGWYKDTSCKTAWNFDKDIVTTNKTLYAKWTDIYALYIQNGIEIPGLTAAKQTPTITAETGAAYSLSTDGTTLTITGNSSYLIKDVQVNGKSKGAVAKVKNLKTGDQVSILTTEIQKPIVTKDIGSSYTLSSDGTTLNIVVVYGYVLKSLTVRGVEQGNKDKVTGLKTGDRVVITTTSIKRPVVVADSHSSYTLSADGTIISIETADGYLIKDVTLNGKSQGAVATLEGLKTNDMVVVYSCEKTSEEIKEEIKEEAKEEIKEDTKEFTPIDNELLEKNLKKIKLRINSKYVYKSTNNGKTQKKYPKLTSEITSGQKYLDEIIDSGYIVKYDFYRGTDKNISSLKKKFTSNTGSYTNTKGTNGKTYYYRAVVKIYDNEGKLAGKTALSQCAYGVRVYNTKAS